MLKVLLLALLSRVPGITDVTVANRYKNILTATLGTWEIFRKSFFWCSHRMTLAILIFIIFQTRRFQVPETS